MRQGKSITQSKTLIFNAAVAVVAVLTEQSDLVRNLLSPSGYLWLMIVIAIFNAYLRLQTTQPVHFSSGKKD